MSICNRNCCENKINSSYIKWLIEVLGPVILGSKPAEILNLSSKDMNKESKLNDIKSFQSVDKVYALLFLSILFMR